MDKYTLNTIIATGTRTGKITFNNKYDLIKYINCLITVRLEESEFIKISMLDDVNYLIEAPKNNFKKKYKKYKK